MSLVWTHTTDWEEAVQCTCGGIHQSAYTTRACWQCGSKGPHERIVYRKEQTFFMFIPVSSIFYNIRKI